MILTRARSIARSLARSLTHIQLLQTVQLLLKYIYKYIHTVCFCDYSHDTQLVRWIPRYFSSNRIDSRSGYRYNTLAGSGFDSRNRLIYALTAQSCQHQRKYRKHALACSLARSLESQVCTTFIIIYCACIYVIVTRALARLLTHSNISITRVLQWLQHWYNNHTVSGFDSRHTYIVHIYKNCI